MSGMKLVDGQQLDADLTAVADAIRAKSKETEALRFPQGFIDSIGTITTDAIIDTRFDAVLLDQLTECVSNATGTLRTYALRDMSALTRVSLPEITRTNGYCFQNCTALLSASLPRCESIGPGLFMGCIALREVYTPMVGALGAQVFTRCGALVFYDAAQTSTIGIQTFSGCTSLVTLILRYNAVCTLDHSNAFADTPIAGGTGYIYVPRLLVDAYKASEVWLSYAAQFRAIEDYPEICGGAT